MKKRYQDINEIKDEHKTLEIKDSNTKCLETFVENLSQNYIKSNKKRKRDRKNDNDSIIRIIVRDFLNYLISLSNNKLSLHRKKLGNDIKKQFFTKDKINYLFNMSFGQFIKLYTGFIKNDELNDEFFKEKTKNIYLNLYLTSDIIQWTKDIPAFKEKIKKIKSKSKKNNIDKIEIIAKHLINYGEMNNNSNKNM